MKNKTILRTMLAAAVAVMAGPLTSQAQLLYLQDFDTDQNASGNWVTNAAGDSPADLYFDYSTIGIPSAPNSGGTTRGAKLNANLGILLPGTFPAGVSVSPLDYSLSPDTNFVIHCDVWLNFNGPAPGGGSGSTQMGGIGFGTAGTTPQIIGAADSLFAVATPEGGSGSDYRVYTQALPGSVQVESGAYVAGSRNNSASYHATNFPGVTAPAAQTILYSQQTGTTADGSQGWAWRDVQIEKIGPFATWSIDGVPIAVVDLTTNGGTFGGDKLVLTHSDINATASADTNAPALAFSLYDNLRVSNIVANVVTVTAPSPMGMESFSTPATFTFARTITGSPLTVNYTIGGTADNGVDYTNQLGGALSGSITFGASDGTVDLVVAPIDDTLSEPEETILITVANGAGYVAAGAATATIEDNDTPLLIVSVDAASMYERHTNDYASVTVTRWGDPFAFVQLETTNLSFSGGAVLNTDFVLNSTIFPVSLNDAETVLTNLVNPLDNSSYTGNKSFEVGLVAGSGFTVSNATASLTIIDDENPSTTVLYSNPLTSAADASNWKLAFENGNLISLGPDFEASFGYDLTADSSGGGVIASPPGGAINALRATVNKSVARNAGLNLYLTNTSFSGDFAVRFNMNIVVDTAGGTTQGPIFGINHDGNQTNWWAGSGSVPEGGPWQADGLWYWISADAGAGAGDYILHTGLGGALPNTGWFRAATANFNAFTKLFKGVGGFTPQPGPYTGPAGPGLVANDAPALGGDTSTWTDVEIKQLGDVVTLYFNKIPVLTYVNTTTFKSGYIMLGYADPFSSIGDVAGAVYYANLSVVEIGPPEITDIARAGSNVTIDFTSNDGTDSASSFTLESASVVSGPYSAVPGAAITQVGAGVYQATASSTADEQYYRISK